MKDASFTNSIKYWQGGNRLFLVYFAYKKRRSHCWNKISQSVCNCTINIRYVLYATLNALFGFCVQTYFVSFNFEYIRLLSQRLTRYK